MSFKQVKNSTHYANVSSYCGGEKDWYEKKTDLEARMLVRSRYSESALEVAFCREYGYKWVVDEVVKSRQGRFTEKACIHGAVYNEWEEKQESSSGGR